VVRGYGIGPSVIPTSQFILIHVAIQSPVVGCNLMRVHVLGTEPWSLPACTTMNRCPLERGAKQDTDGIVTTTEWQCMKAVDEGDPTSLLHS
jgi:hypothetical protein